MGNPLNAWVDESIRATGVPAPMYLLGASVAAPAAHESAAKILKRLAPQGKKLHWRDLGRAGKRKVADALPSLGLDHIVVVGAPLESIKQERARGQCLERLMWELDQRGVTHVLFESRSASQDARDRRRIDGLRTRNVLRPAIRADWMAGAAEPLLWAPDILIGLLGDAKTRGETLPTEISALVTEIQIRL